MRRSVPVGLSGLALALVLAGCSGGSSASTQTAASTGSTTASGAGRVPDGVAQQYDTLAAEIAAEGGETTSGEWRIGYIVEPAEPWYAGIGAEQTLREPKAGETHHVEVIPFEASTGRVVPDVPVRVAVVDDEGTVVDERPLDFYYGEFFHYATNFVVPKAGNYTLRVTLDAPSFLRHGDRGERPALAAGATVEFPDVELTR